MPWSMEARGGCPCCHGIEVVPPLRAPLALHVRGTDGFSLWMAGTFDGRCWWSPEIPAHGGHWTVIGWRALEEHASERTRPCQRAAHGGPRLFRGTGGLASVGAAGAPLQIDRPRPAEWWA